MSYEELLWNPRGTLILVTNPNNATELQNKGWLRASQEEKDRYKPGAYVSMYDKGEQVEVTPIQTIEVTVTKSADTLRVIEI